MRAAHCSHSTSLRWRAWQLTRRVTGSTWCRSGQFSSVRLPWTRLNRQHLFNFRTAREFCATRTKPRCICTRIYMYVQHWTPPLRKWRPFSSVYWPRVGFLRTLCVSFDKISISKKIILRFRVTRPAVRYGKSFRQRPLEKLPRIEDRGQTDRVIIPTCAGVRRWRRPRPHHAARLYALARSRWRNSGNLCYNP